MSLSPATPPSSFTSGDSFELVIDPALTEEAAKVKKIVEYLLMQHNDLTDIISKPLAKKILSTPDLNLMRLFAHELQNALLNIDLKNIESQQELLIAHIISLIPYSYPKLDDTFQIPVKNIEGNFEYKRFRCEKIINMSISNYLTPLKAYGLTSDDGDYILSFTGTTFPAGSGFLNSLIADFTPFSSVGKVPFSKGFSELQSYFQDRHQVRLYGMSLGGSLCLHSFRHFESKIQDIHAIVPPGLHFFDRYNRESQTKIMILTQDHDIVSKLGYFPEHDRVEIYRIKTNGSHNKGLNAHARIFSASSNCHVEQLNTKQVNRSWIRLALTIVHLSLSWLIFLPLMVPFGISALKHRFTSI